MNPSSGGDSGSVSSLQQVKQVMDQADHAIRHCFTHLQAAERTPLGEQHLTCQATLLTQAEAAQATYFTYGLTAMDLVNLEHSDVLIAEIDSHETEYHSILVRFKKRREAEALFISLSDLKA